ncbi:MAG: hypothetical protein RMI34_00750 [Chloroherpetonaceae bacterium]|nr:hypothetical protein [Chloroherpetonaceae bacterium]MCS7212385.1 hypothetical protein [Chloroherpetonaceae bacterium]MDW8018588.1 hypothetical protein [Chloroherpetonaceae bacterium]MDW8467309.1 hypothetical protein [Chloroherpetonaceae bacterium]
MPLTFARGVKVAAQHCGHLARLVLVLWVVLVAACQPPAQNKALIAEIEQFISTLEPEIAKFTENQEHISTEQKEFNEKNAALKKKLGKHDSTYNALTKAHQKIVDEHEAKLNSLKDLIEASRGLIPKLQDGSFAFDRRLIEEDFKGGVVEGKPFDGFKQKADKLRAELSSNYMDRHKELKEKIRRYEAQLDSLEQAAKMVATAPTPQSPKTRKR